ncbi:MAG: geranylgeranylglyceryl/heptaprenylglyceryl phosphate synthase [Bacteroidota bacterium]|jgi:phosphoglycerol geranylgeranyltransferase
MSEIHQQLQFAAQKNNKLLFVLCDPDTPTSLLHTQVAKAVRLGLEWFLVGGSHISHGNTTATVELIKNLGAKYVILFPGSEMQVVPNTDAILFMSLISGRNPEYLIAKQVTAAPFVKKYKIQPLATGYMLVESGKLTSAQYISGTLPLPNDKPEIAAATAMAGEMMGMQYFYLDAGSGAQFTIPGKIIEAVSQSINGFVFVGGGIRTASAALNAWNNGANAVVIGNGVFEDDNLLETIFNAWQQSCFSQHH